VSLPPSDLQVRARSGLLDQPSYALSAFSTIRPRSSALEGDLVMSALRLDENGGRRAEWLR
jgi:hypothetical protein